MCNTSTCIVSDIKNDCEVKGLNLRSYIRNVFLGGVRFLGRVFGNIGTDGKQEVMLNKSLERNTKMTEDYDELRLEMFAEKCAELEKENKELKDYSKRMENQRENYYKEYEKQRKALEEIKDLVKEISYLGSHGERELKFKIRNILEDVIDEEIY